MLVASRPAMMRVVAAAPPPRPRRQLSMPPRQAGAETRVSRAFKRWRTDADARLARARRLEDETKAILHKFGKAACEAADELTAACAAASELERDPADDAKGYDADSEE